MKKLFKHILDALPPHSRWLLLRRIRALRNSLFPVQGKDNRISLHGNIVRLKKSIVGNANEVVIEGATVMDSSIRIRGNNNRLVIESGCIIGKGCSFWLEGNGLSISVGENTTCTHDVHFCAQEDGSAITVGKDNMFSNNIIVRTSDSHPIYSIQDGTRINPPKNVVMGNHIWVAPNSKIMKGAVIEDDVIVGSNTMVSGTVPSHSLVVGIPAKVVKENVTWTREELY